MAKKDKAVASETEVSMSEVSKRIYTLRGLSGHAGRWLIREAEEII